MSFLHDVSLRTFVGFVWLVLFACQFSTVGAQEPSKSSTSKSPPTAEATARAEEVISVWNRKPPGDDRKLEAERDFTKPEDNLIAGRRIIKLGNVTTPELHVFHAAAPKKNGSAVVICPGGGFSILAWDLEGTEIAKWLNTLGVTAIVLKYRVPTRDISPPWKLPVQDAQRAISFVRSKASEWELNSNQIGILGFSAGGKTAAMASYSKDRFYEPMEDVDKVSCRPDFSILIYAAWLAEENEDRLRAEVTIDSDSPPTFMIHTFDDFIHIRGCLLAMLELKKAKVRSELHLYDIGGHGYGLRPKSGVPVTGWTKACEAWLNRNQYFKR